MRKIFLLSLLFVFALAAHGEGIPDTTVVVQQTTAQPAMTSEDSARRKADSLSFMNSYESQKAKPGILYKPKTGVKMPNAAFLGFLIVLALALYLFFKTPLCRDLSYNPTTNILRPMDERPYSYSRVQLFWWTVIVLGCYVSFFIFKPFNEVILALNPTAIILLGGGLATSIFGRVMDNSQIARDNDNSEPDVPVRHQDIEPTQGLFLDILSDEGGITIHRFQAVVFNLVFGLAYIKMFFYSTNHTAYPFPDFEMWQLTLLGISAAGYLGLKANENGTETLERRQVEAVAKNDPNPPGGGGVVVVAPLGAGPGAGAAVPPAAMKAALESMEPAKPTTNAFEIMKAKLHAKGMMPH
jgi:hypothetical protein